MADDCGLEDETLPRLKAVEKAVWDKLKDFQRETVRHVDDLFRHGHRRALVADEVGLGKTVVARGVIAKTAVLRKEEGDDLFKVVYICSNQNIANQNVQKLRVSDDVLLDDDVTQTRLSMQHLKIAQQEHDSDAKKRFVCIIPLTPETSFKVVAGKGKGDERALMCAILLWMCRSPMFRDLLGCVDAERIKQNLQGSIKSKGRWADLVKFYEKKVAKVCEASQGAYPANFCKELLASTQKVKEKDFRGLVQLLAADPPEDRADVKAAIPGLRLLFATESARMLKPDLIIMDEFQRFKFLLHPDDKSESGIIAHEFLSGEHDTDYQKTRILLLSATPYKMYSTAGEIAAVGDDEQYKEFGELLDFLFEGSAADVRAVWGRYTKSLQGFAGVSEELKRTKADAEAKLRGGICRTERASVMEMHDYISDDEAKTTLAITDGDVRSYVEIVKFVRKLGMEGNFPIEYVKSCPYLLSYLRGYKIREEIEKRLRDGKKIPNDISSTLCLSRKRIRKFKKITVTNARLKKLMDVAFQGNAARYVWMPPTLPYYSLQGAYRDADKNRFSKVLVFSAWEMVPRMIGTLVSYEAECRTTGAFCRDPGKQENARIDYFKNSYPPPRLRFAIDYKDDPNGKAKSLMLFTLIYPSKTLRDLYNPIRCLNEGMPLDQIVKDLEGKIGEKLGSLDRYLDSDDGREDTRWYYLAPMLLDGVENAQRWLEAYRRRLEESGQGKKEGDEIEGQVKDGKQENRKALSDRVKGALANCEELSELLNGLSNGDIRLGEQPKKLAETLADMALGSPAVCAARGWRDRGEQVGNGQGDKDGTVESSEDFVMRAGTEIARGFFTRFNQPETISIIELQYNRSDDDYWKDVLRYCRDGCFQAMFDEYYAVLREGQAFVRDERKRGEKILEQMCDALDYRAVPYSVDTMASLQEQTPQKGGGAGDADDSKKPMPMRTYYAVGFIKGKGEETKVSHRKDVIRRSFNSPFRPFVLASTSIGQEGLDFHPYCRKIFHWNLPSNPVDLEQREGRINRYKCLAVRENIALKYGQMKFEKDVWEEMYKAAQEGVKQEGDSDLIPFWCLGKDQEVKIERIVPKYPFSKDVAAYQRLIAILSLYRLSMGQPRQEELLESVMKAVPEDDRDKLKQLFINLSPFSAKQEQGNCHVRNEVV